MAADIVTPQVSLAKVALSGGCTGSGGNEIQFGDLPTLGRPRPPGRSRGAVAAVSSGARLGYGVDGSSKGDDGVDREDDGGLNSFSSSFYGGNALYARVSSEMSQVPCFRALPPQPGAGAGTFSVTAKDREALGDGGDEVDFENDEAGFAPLPRLPPLPPIPAGEGGADGESERQSVRAEEEVARQDGVGPSGGGEEVDKGRGEPPTGEVSETPIAGHHGCVQHAFFSRVRVCLHGFMHAPTCRRICTSMHTYSPYKQA